MNGNIFWRGHYFRGDRYFRGGRYFRGARYFRNSTAGRWSLVWIKVGESNYQFSQCIHTFCLGQLVKQRNNKWYGTHVHVFANRINWIEMNLLNYPKCQNIGLIQNMMYSMAYMYNVILENYHNKLICSLASFTGKDALFI